MAVPSVSRNGVPTTHTPRHGPVHRLLWWVPTAVVLAGLGGAAYWGHTTGWDFTGAKRPDESPAVTPGVEGRPVVRLSPAGGGASPLPGHEARVEFASDEAARAGGIDTTVAWASGLTEQATAAGEVTFDTSRVARVSARAGGVTRRVYKAAGDHVRAGDVLALIDSVAVGNAKAEFQQALVQARLRDRTRHDLVGAKAVASAAAIREAEAALKDAEVRVLAAAQQLSNLGLPVTPADYRALPPADVAERLRLLGVGTSTGLNPADVTATLLPVRAPFAGVVMSTDTVAGETAAAGKVLFTVVDPARVWATLHLPALDARRAAIGQKVFFRPDGETREYPARVVWVGAAADEATRTVPVRAEADNAAGLLRASTLGRGRIVFREEPRAIVLPHGAVQTLRGRAIVFVRDPDFLKPDGPKAFHARSVTLGGRDDKNTEILAGVAPGEVVVTRGSDRLLLELTRATAGR